MNGAAIVMARLPSQAEPGQLLSFLFAHVVGRRSGRTARVVLAASSIFGLLKSSEVTENKSIFRLSPG